MSESRENSVLPYATTTSSPAAHRSKIPIIMGGISVSLGVASIAGGWIYILIRDDREGRLFTGWQWFNANFPFTSVRIAGALAVVMGLIAAIGRSRVGWISLALGVLGLTLRHHW